nr:3347_t:CDS:2 [Entrophospora candida]
MWPGTFGKATVMVNGTNMGDGSSTAHRGFNIQMFDDITIYNLSFAVELSGKKDKTRGPFTNDRDYEWKFTGSVDTWDIEQLSYII